MSSIAGTQWSFLEGVKQSVTPLPRSLLVAACKKNVALFATLAVVSSASVLNSSSDDSSNELLDRGFNHIMSFFTAVVIEISENKAIDDTQVRILYPFVIDGIKGFVGGENIFRTNISYSYLRSSLLIISQLAKHTSFTTAVHANIISAMLNRISSLETSRPNKILISSICKASVAFLDLQNVSMHIHVLLVAFLSYA